MCMVTKSEDAGYKNRAQRLLRLKRRVVEAHARLVSDATQRGRERELTKCALLKFAYHIVWSSLDSVTFRKDAFLD